MSDAAPDPGSSDPIAGAAASWVLRVDRGLSPAEQDAFSAWLAALNVIPDNQRVLVEHG